MAVVIIALLVSMESVLDSWEFHQPILAATLIGIAFGHPVEAAMAPDTALASIPGSILVTGQAKLPVSQGIAIAITIVMAVQSVL
ncbi:hypothetical protein [Periweissella fabaria]|nr:hypothetical protein [Periweissella fabaria]